MGRRGLHREFERYVDAETGRASEEMAARALACNSEVGVVHRRVQSEIGEFMNQLNLSPETDRVALRDFLLAKIQSDLKPDEMQLSMLDLKTLGLTSDARVYEFLLTQDVDLNQPQGLQYAVDVFTQSLKIFDQYIHDRPFPPELRLTRTNPRETILNTFKVASGVGLKRHLIPYACALLRIVRSVDYIYRNPQIRLARHCEERLKRIIEPRIQMSRRKGESSVLYIPKGAPNENIPIVLLKRPEYRLKELPNWAIKLLLKPQNHAKEVIDQMGVRFITTDVPSAVLLMKYLFFDPHAPFPAINIRVDESKQTFFAPESLLPAIQDPMAAQNLFDQLSLDFSHRSDGNPHSQSAYRALQITLDLPVSSDPKGSGSKSRDPRRQEFMTCEFQIWPSDMRRVAPPEEYKASQLGDVKRRLFSNNLEEGFRRRKKSQ